MTWRITWYKEKSEKTINIMAKSTIKTKTSEATERAGTK
jgi:hypothetical protein